MTEFAITPLEEMLNPVSARCWHAVKRGGHDAIGFSNPEAEVNIIRIMRYHIHALFRKVKIHDG
jgi:hypothetical protein